MSDHVTKITSWTAGCLADVISLEYGAALSDKARRVGPVPVFGSNGRVGWHDRSLVAGPGIVVGRKGSVGKLAWSDVPFWPIDTAYFVVPKSVDTDWRWLFWSLDHIDLTRLNAATGVPGLNRNDAYSECIAVPEPEEQTRIAEILDTLDEAIREAEAVIAKLRQVKAGLLHDLLTRGLDEHGHLRDPIRHPDQFQDSPLGLIPKAWGVTTLRDVTNRITDGAHTTVKTVEASNDTVPFLFVSCVRDGRVLWDQAGAISRSTFQDISRGREPSPGMVLFTVVGSYGHAASVQDDSPFSFQRHIACLYPQKDKLDSRFLVHWMNSPGFKVFGDNVALGNAQKTITLGALNLLPCLLPSFPEQQEIMRKITPADARINAEQQNLAKLQILKRGLSHDLLTGRKRVKV